MCWWIPLSEHRLANSCELNMLLTPNFCPAACFCTGDLSAPAQHLCKPDQGMDLRTNNFTSFGFSKFRSVPWHQSLSNYINLCAGLAKGKPVATSVRVVESTSRATCHLSLTLTKYYRCCLAFLLKCAQDSLLDAATWEVRFPSL